MENKNEEVYNLALGEFNKVTQQFIDQLYRHFNTVKVYNADEDIRLAIPELIGVKEDFLEKSGVYISAINDYISEHGCTDCGKKNEEKLGVICRQASDIFLRAGSIIENAMNTLDEKKGDINFDKRQHVFNAFDNALKVFSDSKIIRHEIMNLSKKEQRKLGI